MGRKVRERLKFVWREKRSIEFVASPDPSWFEADELNVSNYLTLHLKHEVLGFYKYTRIMQQKEDQQVCMKVQQWD